MGKREEEMVALNENGRVIGEDHHRSKRSDADVDTARQMHEDGMGYKRIAKVLNVPRATVKDWIKCRSRGQLPHAYKRRTKKGDE